MVVIPVAIAAFPDHDGIVAIAVVTFPDHFTIAIPIPITVAGSDGHAGPTDTNSNFFRASRHCNRNCSYRDGSYYKTLDHRMFLSLKITEKAMREDVNCSRRQIGKRAR